MLLFSIFMACAPRPYHAILRAPIQSHCAQQASIPTKSLSDMEDLWSTPFQENKTAAYILEDGAGALAMRAWLAEQAQSQLVQYFIFSADRVGLLASNELYLAAKQGVKVRLLVDDTLAHGDEQVLLALDGHPNLEVRVYNPNLNIGKKYGGSAGQCGHRLSRGQSADAQ